MDMLTQKVLLMVLVLKTVFMLIPAVVQINGLFIGKSAWASEGKPVLLEGYY